MSGFEVPVVTPYGSVLVRLDVTDPHPVEGLCDDCHNPSLIEIKAVQLHQNGVTQVASSVWCLDCAESDRDSLRD